MNAKRVKPSRLEPKQNNRIEEVKKICWDSNVLISDRLANQICQLFPQPLDDKELREKLTNILGKEFHPYVAECAMVPINRDFYYKVTDQILALLQPKIEEAVIQARKEQMVIDWAQAGKDVEEARKVGFDDGVEKTTVAIDSTIDAQLEKAKREERERMIARVEAISTIIDWEDDIGEMREMKETSWQALKEGEK